jgi:putative spermidine/putrescine transport system ATP-binding protein
MSTLELQGLRKRFGTHVALDGVDLSVAEGELVSLLGPSGCGKTTALRIIAGFVSPDSGTLTLAGRDLLRDPVSKRGIGMVFQAYSLFPNLTAAQNIEFGMRVRRRSGAERRARVAELLELVGLSHAAARYPHQLSGGMQQRVALARALAIEPRILLLDEPLSALDALVRVQLREEIRRLQTQLGATTVYVTHDQEEALSISDSVAVLSQGRIEQIGPPAEIYGSPQTRFVAEFIGSMNRLESVVADGREGLLDAAGGRVAVAAARGRATGDRVLLLVRPESVTVRAENGTPREGVLRGTVTSHSFLGPVTRIRIEADGGDELIATVPSAEAAGLAVGGRVTAGFEPDAARVLVA